MKRSKEFAMAALGLAAFIGPMAAKGQVPNYPSTPGTEQSTQTFSEVPAQADAFVNSVGADTDFTYSSKVYTTRFSAIAQLLIDSGIKHIRDAGPVTDQTYLAKMAMFASHGIHHSATAQIGQTPAQITSMLNAFGPSKVDFIEPVNEYDTYAKYDSHWMTHLVAEQKVLWRTVRGDRAFANIAVLGPALAHNPYYANLGPLDAYEDAGNMHASFCNFNPGTNNGTVNLGNVTRQLRQSTRYKPIWTTETSYDDHTRVCDTPDPIIAKYDPRLVAERWNAGEPRTYFFQFADTPYMFGSTGIVYAAAYPKPQYTAVKSMLGLLADPGPGFRPTPLRYTVGGQTQNIRHTLLQKRDGTYVLMMWIEMPSILGYVNPVSLRVPPQHVTVSVPGMKSATDYTYSPSTWHLAPRALSVQAQGVNLTLTDTISFIELR